jgi:hypothetical protein
MMSRTKFDGLAAGSVDALALVSLGRLGVFIISFYGRVWRFASKGHPRSRLPKEQGFGPPGAAQR